MKIEELPAAAELCNAVATPPDGSDPPSHQTNEGHGLLLWGHKALLRNEREQSTMSSRQLHWPSMRRSPRRRRRRLRRRVAYTTMMVVFVVACGSSNMTVTSGVWHTSFSRSHHICFSTCFMHMICTCPACRRQVPGVTRSRWEERQECPAEVPFPYFGGGIPWLS